jgi:hypothetical protein
VHKPSFLLVFIALLLASKPLILARAQNEAIRLSVAYTFGQKLTFRAEVPTDMKIGSARFFFQIQGESRTDSGKAEISEPGTLIYEMDLTQVHLRAFSTVTYWLEIALPDGQVYTSPRASFYYEDNRFPWQRRENGLFRVHWYQGDSVFAQSLLDVADLGLKNIQSLLPLSQEKPIDIYVYASGVEMRATLQGSGKNWVGAHTDPDLSVMVVSLPPSPEQRLEMERQIPHELMHILLYQWLGNGYANLPLWLNEGLASAAELYPNPDYLILLDKARQQNEVLPIASLCLAFPRQTSEAFLAYAEAASFTRYLYRQYGASGLEKLVKAYADGLACEQGVESALGISLGQLERDWRREALGENPLIAVLTQLAPWLALLVLTLAVPLGLILTGARKRPRIQAARTAEAHTSQNNT